MLGTWLIVAVPVHFLVWNFFMLWFYVLRLPPHRREVNMITEIPNKRQRALRNVHRAVFGDGKRRQVMHRQTGSLSSQVGSFAGSASTEPYVIQMTEREVPRPIEQSTGQTISTAHTMHSETVIEEMDSRTMASAGHDEAASCMELLANLTDMTLLTLLLGEHQEEAEWVTTKTQGSKFSARFGFLFEEHRGPAVGLRDASLEIDPFTGRVDRGELVYLRERPLIVIPAFGKKDSPFYTPKKRIYRYHIQMLTKVLDISKTILVGCIVAGVGNTDDNASSIVALIALSLILILLLRIAKPFPSRWDMFLLLLAELADLIVYTCALFLVLGPDTSEDTEQNIGMALLLSEAFALLGTIIEYSLISVGLSIGTYEGWKERSRNKFFKLVHEVLLMDERYLQKKYADKWMVRTLFRGLNGRIPARHELPWRIGMKRSLCCGWRVVDWYLKEFKLLWEDAKPKIENLKQRVLKKRQHPIVKVPGTID